MIQKKSVAHGQIYMHRLTDIGPFSFDFFTTHIFVLVQHDYLTPYLKPLLQGLSPVGAKGGGGLGGGSGGGGLRGEDLPT